MAKVALLIGVSEYEPGLSPLPAAAMDVQEIRRVLQHPEMGGFAETDIQQLLNPEPQRMHEAIEALFSDRRKDDLVLLYFSGHGIKDESGKLYLATRLTRKNAQGRIVKATAVPASFVHNIMSESRSKRQVVILDCCFSGAFAEGWSAKDDGSVDIYTQLGGEGRVVLTSSTSTQYSFEQQGAKLSTYTRYLVEGIETGAADVDSDGAVSVDELHEYAKKKVKEAAPAMQPEIYAVKEGFKIRLTKAPIGDPKVRYRREVERFAERGEISAIGRTTLDLLRDKLGLLPEQAAAIEAEILEPYREYRKKLKLYEQHFQKAIERENPLNFNTRKDLDALQEALALRNEDVEPIRSEVVQRFQPPPVVQLNQNTGSSQSQSKDFIPPPKTFPRLMGCGVTTLVFGAIAVGVYVSFYKLSAPFPDIRPSPTSTAAPSSCIVTTGKINVRTAPGDVVISQLQQGAKLVTTRTERGDWIEISAPVKGWIYKKYTQPCAASVTPTLTPNPTPTPKPSQKPILRPSTPPATPNAIPTQPQDIIPNPISTILAPRSPKDFTSPPIIPTPTPMGSNSSQPPFGTASKSWCLGLKQNWEFGKQHFGEDDRSIKALMEERNCSYWGISLP